MPGIRTAAQAKAWLEKQCTSGQSFVSEIALIPQQICQVMAESRNGKAHKVTVLPGKKGEFIPTAKPRQKRRQRVTYCSSHREEATGINASSGANRLARYLVAAPPVTHHRVVHR
ncbi:hypothetical protein ALP71_00793 [Pseudomonas coronafaciens pv. garcae]|nr:hypothetical protein ALP71_00793 [Pseudomonas coronafaciens pv. garcae]